jgi:hypothetical protein
MGVLVGAGVLVGPRVGVLVGDDVSVGAGVGVLTGGGVFVGAGVGVLTGGGVSVGTGVEVGVGLAAHPLIAKMTRPRSASREQALSSVLCILFPPRLISEKRTSEMPVARHITDRVQKMT